MGRAKVLSSINSVVLWRRRNGRSTGLCRAGLGRAKGLPTQRRQDHLWTVVRQPHLDWRSVRPGPQRPALTVEGWLLAPVRHSNVRSGGRLNLVPYATALHSLAVQLVVLVEAGLHVNRTTAPRARDL